MKTINVKTQNNNNASVLRKVSLNKALTRIGRIIIGYALADMRSGSGWNI